MADEDLSIHYRTFKFRLLPNKKQHQDLAEICESQRQLYNAALQERIDCYQKTGKGRTYIDQCKAVTALRRDAKFSALPVNLQRWTLKRLDDAYAGFFGRIKRGEKAGFPRFRGRNWFRSFGFNEFRGIRFDGRRIRFKGLRKKDIEARLEGFPLAELPSVSEVREARQRAARAPDLGQEFAAASREPDLGRQFATAARGEDGHREERGAAGAVKSAQPDHAVQEEQRRQPTGEGRSEQDDRGKMEAWANAIRARAQSWADAN